MDLDCDNIRPSFELYIFKLVSSWSQPPASLELNQEINIVNISHQTILERENNIIVTIQVQVQVRVQSQS